MDKITPKSSDVFKANLERAAPLLAKVKANGIGHLIDGKVVPSISGETFEAKSPVEWPPRRPKKPWRKPGTALSSGLCSNGVVMRGSLRA